MTNLIISRFTKYMETRGYECGIRFCLAKGLATIATLALFIIGCVGAAGAFPGATIGWVTVGLGGGAFALNLALGHFDKNKFELIVRGLVAATLVTVGALGGTGILSATQVGWGIIGTQFAAIPFACVIDRRKQREIQNQFLKSK